MNLVNRGNGKEKKAVKFYKKKWVIAVSSIIILILIIVGVIAWKTGSILSKMSVNGGSLFSNLSHSLPGANNQLKGEADGRINVLVLGMRGADDPNGGTLSDSEEVVSIEPKADKVSMISIPRDLYVDNPVTGTKTKLNDVYAAGEQKGTGQGIKYAEQEFSEITGQTIDYTVVVNYTAFTDLLNEIGGVTVTLDKPFEESVQFNQPHVCDSFFNVPTGQWENKIVKHHVRGVEVSRKVPMYPLCTAPKDTEECGGDFKLPAGTQTLNAAQALCYARARETSDDFARSARQQQIIKAVESKLLSAGTLTNFSKLNSILDSLGNNVQTDLQPWEMKRLFEIYTQMKNFTLYQRVLDTSNDPEVGLLVGKSDPVAGDILLPKSGNYDQIQNLFKNIFNLSPKEANAPSDTVVNPASATSSSSTTATAAQQSSSTQAQTTNSAQ